ncbi:NUMOD4 motif-containing HNH endonuclease [Massilia litorea]|uniref:HNH endonuclease n=1 Tax=Massilia litorea TaxID=2769491 RepID=A0A7L9U5P9_9BURK|nr:NUMOD4 motif-containing HNH endonuclease [Massilia litorea]QOL49729.1 HNH endonuclease [Massilia litorea]
MYIADLFDEQWHPVVGFHAYEVSDLGRVRRRLPCPGSYVGKILKLKMDRKGNYLNACLYVHPKVHERPVHQLVMRAFIGPQAKGIEVRHLDGDYLNNRLSNLAYGTRADNIADAKRHGTFPLMERRPGAKLTREQAAAIYLSDERTIVLAARYGIRPNTVRQIKTRETWRPATEGLPPSNWRFKRRYVRPVVRD